MYGVQSTVYRHGVGKDERRCKQLPKGVSRNNLLVVVPCGIYSLQLFLKPVKSLKDTLTQFKTVYVITILSKNLILLRIHSFEARKKNLV
jgi:hypothetical protein